MSQPAQRTLLILTNRADFATDFLITRLVELNLPYFRLDADVLASTQVSCRFEATAAERHIALGAKSLDLASVGSVWYRRALHPTDLGGVDAALRGFATMELRQLFEGLLAEEVRWVNPLAATELAERKLLQLRIAPACGLAIPATIVSTDRASLISFVEQQEAVICKPISQGFLGSVNEQYAVFTRSVTTSDLRLEATAALFPTLLQRRVPRGQDVRVTIIGSRTFPVEIILPDSAPVDWRATSEGMTYRLCELPTSVESGCRNLMKRFGLEYGAFDFIRSPNGDWVFLEVNPAGEWAWLEVALGLPMRDAFIDLFYGDPGRDSSALHGHSAKAAPLS